MSALTAEQRLRMLQTPAGKLDMVLDTDAYNEIDDQFAIAYSLNAPERLNVKAFYAAPFLNEKSVSPEDGMERSREEIIKLLRLTGKEREVLPGSRRYLPDEKTPVESEAARHLAALADQYSPEKPLYTVAIGAITNVASALLMNPGIAGKMVVVWLGGHALDWPNNREFNCMQDVAAARAVFGSGVPLVMLPCMGVVSEFRTTGPELEYWLAGKNPLCDYLARNTIREAESYAKGKPWSRVIWDVCAVGWLMNENGQLMSDRLIPTPIPQYDHHYSQDPGRPFCRYVYHISRDALFEDLIRHIA